MQRNNNPFRNGGQQNNVGGINSNGEKRGISTRGRGGMSHSGDRGFFSGRGQFRDGGGRRGGHKFGQDGLLTEKEKNWGAVKFNPVAATAKEEYATPWKKLRYDLEQNKDVNTANQIEVQAAKDLKEKLDKNNRKKQILLNQQQPTKWDDFGATDVKSDDSKKLKKGNTDQAKNNTKSKQKQSFQTRKSASVKGQELLQNFQNNNLSIAQKNNLRRLITKSTCLVKGTSFADSVKGEELKVKRWKLKAELKSKSK